MPLKLLLKSLEEVEENLRALYKEDEAAGGFILDTDDKSFKQKIGEFRDNNTTLEKERKKLQEAFDAKKDIDLEKYQKALAAQEKLDKLDDAELMEKGKFDELFNKRTDAMRKDWESKLKAKDDALATTQQELQKTASQLDEFLISGEAKKHARQVGNLRADAEDVLELLAQNTWKRKEGSKEIQAFHPSTKEPLYGKDGEPITMAEWSQGLLDNASYLFKPGKGSGADEKEKTGVQDFEGKKVLRNPDDETFGKYAADIAAGKVLVVRE
jgi:hypothetical protein